MSLFKRERSPFWYCEVQVAGRRVVRSTRTDSYKEAQSYERRLRIQLEDEAASPRKRQLTLDVACGTYWLERGSKLSWAPEVQRTLQEIIRILGKDTLIADIGPDEIEALVAERMRPKRVGTTKRVVGAGAAGVNRTLAVLRSVLRRPRCRPHAQAIVWADHWQKESKGRVRYLQPDDVGKLIDALRVRAPHIADAFEWSVYSGCRRGETFGIRRADIREDHVAIAGKTGPRVVWLSAELSAILARIPADRDPVFSSRNHRKHWTAALAEVGIDDFRWHDARHTFATWLRKAGAPLEVVQRALGHATLAMTMRYAHVDDHEVKDAMRRLPTVAPGAENVLPLKKQTPNK